MNQMLIIPTNQTSMNPFSVWYWNNMMRCQKQTSLRPSSLILTSRNTGANGSLDLFKNQTNQLFLQTSWLKILFKMKKQWSIRYDCQMGSFWISQVIYISYLKPLHCNMQVQDLFQTWDLSSQKKTSWIGKSFFIKI